MCIYIFNLFYIKEHIQLQFIDQQYNTEQKYTKQRNRQPNKNILHVLKNDMSKNIKGHTNRLDLKKTATHLQQTTSISFLCIYF